MLLSLSLEYDHFHFSKRLPQNVSHRGSDVHRSNYCVRDRFDAKDILNMISILKYSYQLLYILQTS